MAVELRQERHGGVLVLAPCGRLDNESAADFELGVQELLGAGERHLVVDLAGLNYISNAGLRVLAAAAKALNAPATSLRVCGLTPAVRQVFDAAGFSAMFDLYPDQAAALSGHPAARGADLGALAARLLGCEAATVPEPPAGPDAARLAALAMELLATAQQPRAARAMADGTRMVPRVAAPVAPAPAPPSAAPWWKRLLGR